MIDKVTRKRMEDLIYNFFDLFDPTGRNTEWYKNKFKDMSNAQFDKFFGTLFKEKVPYLRATMVDYENPMEIDNYEKAAKFLNVPLFEEVIIPYASPDPSKPIVSKYKCVVGYLNMKRMQQLNFKKLGLSTETSERNMLTGQVTGHDKNSRNSDNETSSMLAMGANKTLKEFMSARADDMVMKKEMNQSIMRNGYVALNDLTDDVANKTALNTTSVFFMGAGIMNDLVGNDYVLPKTKK